MKKTRANGENPLVNKIRVALIILGAIACVVFVQHAFAHEDRHDSDDKCKKYQKDRGHRHDKCFDEYALAYSPTPTPTPTPTPSSHCHTTSTPTPTPDFTPSPTEVEPTPTPPTPTPTPTQNIQNTTSNPVTIAVNTDVLPVSSPAVPTCTIAFNAPLLQGFEVLGNGSVNYSWWGVDGVDKYSIIYGYSPDSLIFGQDNIPANTTNITLNGLTPGRNIWAQVWAWKNGCAEMSNLLDPIVK